MAPISITKDAVDSFRLLADALPSMTWVSSTDASYELISKSLLDFIGLSSAHMLSRDWTAYVHADDVQRYMEARSHYMADRRKFTVEYRLLRSDGEYRWISEQGSPRWIAGEFAGYIGSLTDITEQRQAAERIVHLDLSLEERLTELRLSEERFSKAFRSSPVPMLIARMADGRIVDMNDSFLRMGEYSRSDVIGKTSMDLNVWFSDTDRQRLGTELREHGRVAAMEAHFRTRLGNRVIGNVCAECIHVAGDPCVILIVQDVTEQRLAQRRLEEKNAYFNALIENSPLATLVSDPEWHVEMCNPAFERLFQYAQSELVGKDIRQMLGATEVASDSEPGAAFESRGVVQFTGKRRRKDGTFVEVAVHHVPLQLDGRRMGLYAIYEDISQRSALEAQLRQAQKMEAVGRLAGGVAHDFNNLLMVVKSYAEMMTDDVVGNEKLTRYVQEVSRAAERAISLTSQLLAFSRKQMLMPAVLDLNSIVGEAAGMIKRLIGEDIELAFSPGNALWHVHADRDQIVQVLMNLCVNSRDAIVDGGKITIETKNVCITKDCVQKRPFMTPGNYVMLSVSDTGAGISREMQEHIFEPFFTTKGVGKGTGLGLSTVYGIVKQSGGSIFVYSEPGEGTCFKIYLPQAEQAVTATLKSHQEKVQRGTETVLVVEDEHALRFSICEYLTQLGYTVMDAECGEDAIALADKHGKQISVLITDVVMPRIGGRQLSHALKARLPHLKTIYMSGYTDDAVVRHGVLDPGVAFLHKPFGLRSLAGKLREVLDIGDVVH